MFYFVVFEKHVTKYKMTYSRHKNIEDAIESYRQLTSINTIDKVWIEVQGSTLRYIPGEGKAS